VTLDDLELELRKLPGVRSAGFVERDDVLLVQLHVAPESTERGVSLAATRIAFRHSERPVAVELVRWRTRELTVATNGADARQAAEGVIDAEADTGAAAEVTTIEERVRLLAVLNFPDTDELEVHLILGGQRAIGRAAASRGLVGAVEATVDALKTFVLDLRYRPSWAQPLETGQGESFLVACELVGPTGAVRHGIASGTSSIEAAARGTLHALNRTLALELEADRPA
jgi:hypothetical protein